MILDTNALSAYADADPDILEPVRQAQAISIPTIVLGEYRLGIQQSRHRVDYENWLEELVLKATVLPVDAETTRCYASVGSELKKLGKPIPTNDMWIAALCRQHRLPLLSKDHHFDAVVGLQRLSW